jgi:hypothetical protein
MIFLLYAKPLKAAKQREIDEKDAILSIFINALLEYSFCGREGD